MKAPSILILLTIFVTYVAGFDYQNSEEAAGNQKDQQAKFRREALYGASVSSSASASEEAQRIPLSDWADPVRLNMFQFVTNVGCRFFEHEPWFPYLDDYITAELRVRLSNWCAKYTNIVY